MNLNAHAKQTHGPPDNRPGHPQTELRSARGTRGRPGTTSPRSRASRPLGWGSVSLEGRTPPRAELRLTRGLDAPPLARGPFSIESQTPPRASFRLARGHHGPAAPIPAPPTGAFNALTPAGVQIKGESTPLRAWESCPGTPRRCATLCGMVSNHLAALYHPLRYSRRTAPSKKDGGTLEGKTHDYSAPARDSAVTSGLWEHSPPSPSALCDNPDHRDAIPATASPYSTLWKHAATGHRHASNCALYDVMSTAPSSPHADGPQTSNLYATPLEATPGHAQDTPWRPARSGIRQDDRLLHGIVRHASTRS
jgi:hypothetical protein